MSDKFIERKPDPCLQGIVECYWTEVHTKNQDASASWFHIVPDNTVEMIFSSAPIYRANRVGQITVHRTHLSGLKTHHQLVKVTNEVIFCIRFKPHALHPFVLVPLPELINQNVGLNDVLGNDVVWLEDAILNAGTFEKQVQLAENYLIGRLRRFDAVLNSDFNTMVYSVLASKGRAEVSRLANDAGVSQRTLGRMFQKYLGLSPKSYLKVLRLVNASKGIVRGEEGSLLNVALENGYYDQMHFVKDMKEHFGTTPTGFIRLDKTIQMPVLTDS